MQVTVWSFLLKISKALKFYTIKQFLHFLCLQHGCALFVFAAWVSVFTEHDLLHYGGGVSKKKGGDKISEIGLGGTEKGVEPSFFEDIGGGT